MTDVLVEPQETQLNITNLRSAKQPAKVTTVDFRAQQEVLVSALPSCDICLCWWGRRATYLVVRNVVLLAFLGGVLATSDEGVDDL